ELIEKVKSLRGQGLNIQRIADLLQGLNLPTERGGKWSRKTVYTLLRKCR
ncbi:MAG: recombinase family protein, partial [Bdellovibrionales bacterium]|nr:recombinase family protein [Bdellovibrionales bacterium]